MRMGTKCDLKIIRIVSGFTRFEENLLHEKLKGDKKWKRGRRGKGRWRKKENEDPTKRREKYEEMIQQGRNELQFKYELMDTEVIVQKALESEESEMVLIESNNQEIESYEKDEIIDAQHSMKLDDNESSFPLDENEIFIEQIDKMEREKFGRQVKMEVEKVGKLEKVEKIEIPETPKITEKIETTENDEKGEKAVLLNCETPKLATTSAAQTVKSLDGGKKFTQIETFGKEVIAPNNKEVNITELPQMIANSDTREKVDDRKRVSNEVILRDDEFTMTRELIVQKMKMNGIGERESREISCKLVKTMERYGVDKYYWPSSWREDFRKEVLNTVTTFVERIREVVVSEKLYESGERYMKVVNAMKEISDLSFEREAISVEGVWGMAGDLILIEEAAKSGVECFSIWMENPLIKFLVEKMGLESENDKMNFLKQRLDALIGFKKRCGYGMKRCV
ncbi:hypothetical protein EIN_094140 [Entamoeba invadens IP1]|uniref:Uncharacterized protein n=1 Tax=Entamoeba invadens IP1 TaxID=370355 RepID=A0A0A1U012_ENTIV|nr:hypothetical protein EIN_094140 [Entamoeba invadens IP1]ELP87227.1 hypothetical protein EIN_094140 [Entamoeba invadens IP1]|eukprot:XP_004253998.1 hypothetical protein EIN_094140 [Entamoeba invadens IP1]